MKTRLKPQLPDHYDDSRLKSIFPRWVPIVYGTACLLLLPWVIALAYWLPPRYTSVHWDVAWSGFDVFLGLLFALTALLAVKRSSWTALSAAMLGTALLIDGWFDITTAHPGPLLSRAWLAALFIEVPLALLSFTISHRIYSATSKAISNT